MGLATTPATSPARQTQSFTGSVYESNTQKTARVVSESRNNSSIIRRGMRCVIMGELEYGVNINNKFGALGDDEDLTEILTRAQKEKKEKAKQAKLALKKSAVVPAPVVVAAPAKPAKEAVRDEKIKQRRAPLSVNCHACNQTGHFAKDCRSNTKTHDKPSQERRSERKDKRESGGRPNNEERRSQQMCYNCGQTGHVSRVCAEPKKSRERRADKEEGVEPTHRREQQNCYNCGQTGHVIRDCAEPKKRENRDKPVVTCYNCHQSGHISRDCTEVRHSSDENTVPKRESKPTNNNGSAQGVNAEEQPVDEQGNQKKEPPKLTLSEWKAQQKQAKTVLNPRQADRTDKNLQNFEVLKREDDKSGDDSYEYEEIEVQSKRAQNTKVLDIDVNFANTARGPSSFGRRDQRDGGNRPQLRGVNQGARFNNSSTGPSGSGARRQQNLKLDQDQEFPALG